MAYEKEGELATDRKWESPRITNPTSAYYARDKYPYTYIHCDEVQKIANADSTSSYTSSLPFGIQWDLVCEFLTDKVGETVDVEHWGNYRSIIRGWSGLLVRKVELAIMGDSVACYINRSFV